MESSHPGGLRALTGMEPACPSRIRTLTRPAPAAGSRPGTGTVAGTVVDPVAPTPRSGPARFQGCALQGG